MKSQSYASFMTDSAKLRVHSSWRLILGLSLLAILALSPISFYQPRLGLLLAHSRTIGGTALGPAIPTDPPVTTGLIRTWGGPFYDSGVSVAVDASGNIIMAGETNSFGVGPSNAFVVKYDPSGNVLWQKTWGNLGGVTLVGAGLDSQGSVYFAAYNNTYSSGPRNFVVKFDSSGTLQWQKAWGGPAEYLGGFTTDPSGNSYITGLAYDFYPRAFIVKLDAGGNLVWQKTWGRNNPSGTDSGARVAVDASGNVYVTGFTYSFPIGGSYTSVFVLKLDSMGNMQWQKTWSSGGYDYSQAVATDPSGNIYISGYAYASGGQARVFLLKLDSFGNLVWPRTWSESPGYGYGALTSDSSGNIYITAQAFNPPYSIRVALAKIAASGNLLWQVAWGGNYDNAIPSGVAVDSAGNLVLTGEVLQPAPYYFAPLSGLFPSSSSNMATPPGTLAMVNSSLSMVAGMVTTPSGSSTYAGGGDAFILTVPSAGPTNILKTTSSISLSIASLQTIIAGGSVRVSGIIAPPTNGTVTLMYIRPDGSSINRTVTSDPAGSFTDTFSPDKSGLWQVQASWSGNAQTNGAQSALQSFEVQDAPSFLTTNLPWLILAGVVGGFLITMVLTKPKGPKAS